MLHFEWLLSNATYCTGHECSHLVITFCRASTAVYFPKTAQVGNPSQHVFRTLFEWSYYKETAQ